ncbi:hypothetical protein [Hahella sp. CCB-MM4]|uniref:tetratricopeptide repeat protein n=1 Tax=Hahella sp. (strain CCB-MM4) TaxID=1926491 RepID=UPI001FEFA73D|nr:hypothetical protein [Hahella sp. CCB-MM4]
MNKDLRTEDILNPQQYDWLSGVATVYLQTRQYAKAQPLLSLLVRLYPSDQKPLMQLAYLHYLQGNAEQALKCCDRCESSAQGVKDRRLYLLRSFCHLKLGNKNLATDNYHYFSASRMMP